MKGDRLIWREQALQDHIGELNGHAAEFVNNGGLWG